MTTSDSVLDVKATTARPHQAGPKEPYTGVVVIHGLGIIKRNTTLEEAVNTLAYWFNHKARLPLQREGHNGVWVRARLTDDPNPDAAPACASLSLAAPVETVDAFPSGNTGAREAGSGNAVERLKLDFREVWWAESFGVPSVGATIAWGRVQAWEQASHLLLPIARRLGRRRQKSTSNKADTQMKSAPLPDPSKEHEVGIGEGEHVRLSQAERSLFKVGLRAYSVVQYVWKAVQWLLITPLVLLLLLVMGVVRILVAFIPPLQSTIVASISALLDTIMLHWVAEAQVYTLDYTRSAGIRERFESEVVKFLEDDACKRIVVIAHSMGTVIAYEGLTTIFNRPEFSGDDGPKPVTFICLAQALRRIWLMAADDPHRVHGVLPKWVNWIHFWAHYDPVAAGPMTSRTLPPLPVADPHINREMKDLYRELACRLDGCHNVGVVNTDSTFTDHTTYWQNMEEVVGPIARELVRGHPTLERIVQAHVATPDDILVRRSQVAARTTLALIVGLGLGLALVLWDRSQNWQRLGKTLDTSFLQLASALLGTVTSGFGTVLNDLKDIIVSIIGTGQKLAINGFPLPNQTTSYAIWSIAASLVVMGVSILVVGRSVALRSPLALAGRGPVRKGREWSLFVLCAIYLEIIALYQGITSLLPLPSGNVFLTDLGIFVADAGLCCGLLAFLLAVRVASRRGQWGWELAILLLTGPYVLLLVNAALGYPLVGYSTVSQVREYVMLFTPAAAAGAVVGELGALLYLWVLIRRRHFGSFTVLLLLDASLVFAAIAVPNAGAIVLVGFFMPVFAFALVTWVGPVGIRRALPAGGNILIDLPIIALVLLNVIALVTLLIARYSTATVLQSVPATVVAYAAFGVATLMSLSAMVGAGIHAVQHRRWGWLLALILTIIAMVITVFLAVSGTSAVNVDAALYIKQYGYLAPYLNLICVFASPAALAYALLGGSRLGARHLFTLHGGDHTEVQSMA